MSYDPTKIFLGTAHYCARYRPNYPTALFDYLVARFELGATTQVVDVGCGTGQIALGLASRGISVVALDPEPEMLAEANTQLLRAGLRQQVTLVLGRGEQLLELVEPPVRVVTFGASFHWMSREVVLHACDRLVDHDGGVVVISSSGSSLPSNRWQEDSPDGATPEWAKVTAEITRRFLGPQRRAGPDGFYTHPEARHEQVLERSAFSRIEMWRDHITIVRTADEVIGLQFSTSFCSPAVLGERKDEFERTLRDRLRALGQGDRFVQDYEIEVLCAFRPR